MLFGEVVFQGLEGAEGLEASEYGAGEVLALFYGFNPNAMQNIIIALILLHALDLRADLLKSYFLLFIDLGKVVLLDF